MAFQQAQMHADGMHGGVARHAQHAMQQATAFVPVHADVVVFVAFDGVARQDGVAMVPRRVDRVAPIGVVRP
ncbi:hypothetical protein D3C72_2080540 [compost metagenome]